MVAPKTLRNLSFVFLVVVMLFASRLEAVDAGVNEITCDSPHPAMATWTGVNFNCEEWYATAVCAGACFHCERPGGIVESCAPYNVVCNCDCGPSGCNNN